MIRVTIQEDIGHLKCIDADALDGVLSEAGRYSKSTAAFVRSSQSVKEVDMHITMRCSGRCKYCYKDNAAKGGDATVFDRCSVRDMGYEDGIRHIATIHYILGAEDLVFVGGDPCCNPHLVEFLVFAKLIGMNTCVLSNTHVYLLNGKEIPIDKVAPFIDEMDFTLHGQKDFHDQFNGDCGSHDRAFAHIRQFIEVRSSEQSVGIVLNMVKDTISNIRNIMEDAIYELGLNPQLDFFTIQRIAPSGNALNDWEAWKITPELVKRAFEEFDFAESHYGIKTKACIDAFPWCSVPEQYWHYLESLEGGCNWGKPGGVLSVMQDGTVQRCALCGDHLGANLDDFKDMNDFARFMLENPALCAFNERRHLSVECMNCRLLPRCGGGCVIANTSEGRGCGDPYLIHPTCPPRGMDYLAQGPL